MRAMETNNKILVINAGSSSLKYACNEPEFDARTTRGNIERIGGDNARLTQHGPHGTVERELPKGGYREAFAAMLRILTEAEIGPLRELNEIQAVGHRVVHGGERFKQATRIDATVLAEIELLASLAPLHNPVNAAGIREAQAAFPAVPHVAVFDTTFHQTLKPAAFLYGLPYEYYADKNIRRYGFHGTSHQYVSRQAARFLGRSLEDLAIISCHLGNGASVCAIDGGRSVETSMGFTPGEGLIMGTRCGDIDSAVLTHLMRTDGVDGGHLDDILTRRSGLLGMSGVSGDMREIEAAAAAGNERASIALDAFCHRLRKYIGAYLAVLGRLDVIVFTAGIGQGSAVVRQRSLDGLTALGISLDPQRNSLARGFEQICRISSDDSRVFLLVVPTDEERMIAQLTLETIRY